MQRIRKQASKEAKDRAGIAGNAIIRQLVAGDAATVASYIDQKATTPEGIRSALKLILQIQVIILRRLIKG